MDYYFAFIDGLKLLPRYLFNFLKKLVGVSFLYGITMGIPVIVAGLIGWLLSLIPGISPNAAGLVFKIIASVGQIIPLSMYLSTVEDLAKTQEDAPELCFAVCVTVIMWILKL
jgi:hypothetical protein